MPTACCRGGRDGGTGLLGRASDRAGDPDARSRLGLFPASGRQRFATDRVAGGLIKVTWWGIASAHDA